MNTAFFLRAYTGLLGVAATVAILALLNGTDPAPWWGVLLAVAPMALHFTLRATLTGRPRKRWLMPQQVFTIGGLGLTINPDSVEQPSILASGLAAALVVMLYIYVLKVWRRGVEQDRGAAEHSDDP
ncbi:MAG: hypothetical protein WD251_08415, partial [Saccharospirillum sp.]|uniref:hypothetical protein n=1 Tax=Saccharospirillum sp. TaxID=2033801 RepID=UPI00349FDE82